MRCPLQVILSEACSLARSLALSLPCRCCVFPLSLILKRFSPSSLMITRRCTALRTAEERTNRVRTAVPCSAGPTDQPPSSWSLSELSVRPNALLLLRVISCPCALERAAFLLYTKRGGDLPVLLHPFTFSVHLIYSIFCRASCPFKAGDDE